MQLERTCGCLSNEIGVVVSIAAVLFIVQGLDALVSMLFLIIGPSVMWLTAISLGTS